MKGKERGKTRSTVAAMSKTGQRRPARQVRLSQTVAPFGVGNIYDLLGESFIACDTLRWKQHGDALEAARLAKALNVSGFRSAPVQWDSFGATAPGIPYFRFPQWLFCQVCRRMIRWRAAQEKSDESARCGRCRNTPRLVPMRFVMACEDGHLGDVPWDRWTHFGAKTPNQKQCE